LQALERPLRLTLGRATQGASGDAAEGAAGKAVLVHVVEGRSVAVVRMDLVNNFRPRMHGSSSLPHDAGGPIGLDHVPVHVEPATRELQALDQLRAPLEVAAGGGLQT